MTTTDNNSKGYVRNGFICGKGGDEALFVLRLDGTIVAQLDGYAVIPMEMFAAMGGTNTKTYRDWARTQAIIRNALEAATAFEGIKISTGKLLNAFRELERLERLERMKGEV